MKSSKLTMQYAIVDDLRKKGSFKVNKREMCRHINSDITIGTHFGHDFVTSWTLIYATTLQIIKVRTSDGGFKLVILPSIS